MPVDASLEDGGDGNGGWLGDGAASAHCVGGREDGGGVDGVVDAAALAGGSSAALGEEREDRSAEGQNEVTGMQRVRSLQHAWQNTRLEEGLISGSKAASEFWVQCVFESASAAEGGEGGGRGPMLKLGSTERQTILERPAGRRAQCRRRGHAARGQRGAARGAPCG